MAFNISVGGTDLNLGTDARKIIGQPVNVRSTAGVHTIRVTFHLQADTTSALQTAWKSAQASFNTKNKRVLLNYDDGAGDPLEDITQGKNGYQNIITSISQTEGAASTAYSIEAVLDVVATFEEEDGLGGQVGEISVTKFLTEGQVEARSLTVTFKNSDDGGTTGLANYTSGRSTLLTTYMGTDSDGGRNSSTGLALTGENVRALDESDNLVVVTLVSEEVVVDFSSETSLRSSDLNIQTSQPDAWPEDADAGPIPTSVIVNGSVSVDKDALSGNLHDVWDTIRSQVETEVKTQTGKSDITLVTFSLVSDRKVSLVSFNAVYRADNLDVFNFRRVDRESENPQYRIYTDADGKEVIQKRPGPNPMTRTITINRVGVGLGEMNPDFEGFNSDLLVRETAFYVLINRNEAIEGPIQQGDISGIFLQESSFTYRRVNATGVDLVEIGI